MTKASRYRLTGHLDREEGRHQVRTENAASRLSAPVPQQTTAHVVLASDRREAGAGPLAFSHDPQLLLNPPTASPLNSGNDFHPPFAPPLAALLRTPLRPDTRVRRTRRSSPDAYFMPARIVVVHDDPYFREHLTTSLNDSGYEAIAFEDSLLAWDALGRANRIEVLITRVQFEAGKPYGIALAQWARSNRPGVHVLFTARRRNSRCIREG
jgi:CheY-like chemotaxis protein